MSAEEAEAAKNPNAVKGGQPPSALNFAWTSKGSARILPIQFCQGRLGRGEMRDEHRAIQAQSRLDPHRENQIDPIVPVTRPIRRIDQSIFQAPDAQLARIGLE